MPVGWFVSLSEAAALPMMMMVVVVVVMLCCASLRRSFGLEKGWGRGKRWKSD
jgi:hypothetical protein